jgi:peptidoglycan-associated lipoprotein
MKRQLTTQIRVLLACTAALALGLSACATTSEDDASDYSPMTESEVPGGDMRQGNMPLDTDEGGGDIALGTIYFDYDRSDIRADAREVLRANAEALRTGGAAIIIEGHCDERGSEEYNQALGERRASAVKRYLENLGVARNKMRIVSYGETRPSVAGHTEAAWRYNRNASFVLQ